MYLEQQAFNTVIENDLRLAINDGLDKLVLDAIAAVGLPGAGHRPAARLDPQGDDHDPAPPATTRTR